MTMLLHFILMTYLTCLKSLYDWLDWIKNNSNIFCILTGPKCKEHKVTITSKLG